MKVFNNAISVGIAYLFFIILFRQKDASIHLKLIADSYKIHRIYRKKSVTSIRRSVHVIRPEFS